MKRKCQSTCPCTYPVVMNIKEMSFLVQCYDKAKCNIPLTFTSVACFFSQSWNDLRILCHPTLPALRDFLAYMDASGAQDYAAVFGLQ